MSEARPLFEEEIFQKISDRVSREEGRLHFLDTAVSILQRLPYDLFPHKVYTVKWVELKIHFEWRHPENEDNYMGSVVFDQKEICTLHISDKKSGIMNALHSN